MIIWTDKAIEAFWRAMPEFRDNLSKKQTIAILDAAVKYQGIEEEIMRLRSENERLQKELADEKKNFIPLLVDFNKPIFGGGNEGS